MLASRGVGFLRAVKNIAKMNRNQNVQQVRNSGHVGAYRLPAAPPDKRVLLTGEIISGVAWWWILWHLWHEPEHITGEFEYPDASKWTDEELGIPPDDVDV